MILVLRHGKVARFCVYSSTLSAATRLLAHG